MSGKVRYTQTRPRKLGGGPGTLRPSFSSPGGTRPYIWFGSDAGECVGWIDDVRTARAMYQLCARYLRSRGKRP